MEVFYTVVGVFFMLHVVNCFYHMMKIPRGLDVVYKTSDDEGVETMHKYSSSKMMWHTFWNRFIFRR